jgi:hypothetical protein
LGRFTWRPNFSSPCAAQLPRSTAVWAHASAGYSRLGRFTANMATPSTPSLLPLARPSLLHRHVGPPRRIAHLAWSVANLARMPPRSPRRIVRNRPAIRFGIPVRRIYAKSSPSTRCKTIYLSRIASAPEEIQKNHRHH